jgi:prepilin-type N-terminal cleavage/methylation domain-containing protein/prepilin-type processing-associated H-X9-DG protein
LKVKHSGITLVETLVAIAIVGVLALLSISWYKNVMDRANQARCVGNMRGILAGAISFAAERQGKLWSRTEVGYSKYRMVDDPLGLPKLLEDFVAKKSWICYGGRKSLLKFGNSYTWNATVQFETDNMLTFPDPHSTLVIWDTYAYSLPSMYNASEDYKGDGTSATGPQALNSKYQVKPHYRNTSVNWGFVDGHVISGATAKQ